MTKMAATPIYGKNPSKFFFSGTDGPISTKLGMLHWGLLPIIVCSNEDHGVTLSYFTARSNLVTLAFSIEKSENSGFFHWSSGYYIQPFNKEENFNIHKLTLTPSSVLWQQTSEYARVIPNKMLLILLESCMMF